MQIQIKNLLIQTSVLVAGENPVWKTGSMASYMGLFEDMGHPQMDGTCA